MASFCGKCAWSAILILHAEFGSFGIEYEHKKNLDSVHIIELCSTNLQSNDNGFSVPSFFSNEKVLTVLILVIISGVIIFGVARTTQRMSDTDWTVTGCWSGEDTNTAGVLVEIDYLLWAGGDYTITGPGFSDPIFERGTYTTSSTEDGTILLTLTPDTTNKYTAQFSQFGMERTLSVVAQKTNYGLTLSFDGGAPFVTTSCQQHIPQV